MSTSTMPLAQPKRGIDADTGFEAVDFLRIQNICVDGAGCFGFVPKDQNPRTVA
ncbi:hypothetical protein [Rhizobium sp. P28RR-XV]|uniref:hypothetical protein n=1 Tax=Rhizobium sp. P28RR-XV TaxID=2726737 RepID=UPI001456DE73|nr:hypothetical protein [Rhizobium sp. P28RR-XV]NLR88431.1 hypothetical protein [Rhizobium sp. P28RR-XV]